MVMISSFLALASGLLLTVLLGIVLGQLLRRLLPSWSEDAARLSPTATFVHLGITLATTAAGGYLTATVAGANALVHVLALAIIVLALAALSALQNRDKRSHLFLLLQVALSPIGIFAGGLIRLRYLGIL